MAVLVFLSFWILVALGLVLIGIRSGRRPRANQGGSAGGRAYWFVGFAVIVAGFGVGVPIAASFGRQDDSRQDAKSDITNLTPAQEHGRELFHKYCSVCHTLEAAHAVAQVGPNLDQLAPTKGLILDALTKGRAQGNGAMAKDIVVGADAQDVADFVTTAVGTKKK